MPVTQIPDSQHLVRIVPRKHQIRNNKGEPIGITWAAFDLRPASKTRPAETYLSCNCIEDASDDQTEALKKILSILKTKLKTKNSLLTIGNVGAIKSAFTPHSVRIVSEKKATDPTYAAVRRYPLDRQLALDKLAAQQWADWYKVSHIEQ